jgi:glycosyltransferase involved in cell wall biosynthesis
MKISIVTVCLNSDETIEDTIKSVLNQSYDDIEHIIVDGESSDGTLSIIEKYRDKISKYVSEPDKGLYDAMNKGIKLVTGDVVGFLNADDFYANNDVIKKIAGVIQDKDVDCCYGDLEYVSPDNPDKTIRRWKSQSYRNGLFRQGWHPPHPTFFAQKNAFDKYGTFDLNYSIGADYELMLRFLQKYNMKTEYIPHVLVKMRNGGKSNKNMRQIIKANIECYRAWKKNGLKVTPLIMLNKPASKLVQFLKKS